MNPLVTGGPGSVGVILSKPAHFQQIRKFAGIKQFAFHEMDTAVGQSDIDAPRRRIMEEVAIGYMSARREHGGRWRGPEQIEVEVARFGPGDFGVGRFDEQEPSQCDDFSSVSFFGFLPGHAAPAPTTAT